MSSCPECDAQRAVYGFVLEVGGTYMTKVPEIKNCCPVEVVVTDIDSLKVYFTHKDKNYEMNKRKFLSSSWRKYDSF